MRSVVLLSSAIHPVSLQPSCHTGELAAWQLAQPLASALEAIHVGAEAAVMPYAGYGISPIGVVATDAVVASLCGYVQEKQIEIVWTGTQAKGGEDTGMVPYLLAQALGFALVSAVLEVTKTENGLQVVQDLGRGKRRTLHVQTPVVLAVADSVRVHLRYSQRNVLQADIYAIQAVDEASTLVQPAFEARQISYKKIAIQSKQSGHQRLQNSIETKAVEGEIIQEGEAKDKAQALLVYLRKHGIKL